MYINRLGTGNLYQSTEPLGLKALAAFVEEKGYSAYVYSGSVHEAVNMLGITSYKCDDETAGKTSGVSENIPDAVGLYCDFETLSAVESFSRFIKENTGIKVFVGGPQAVALDEGFLKASKCDAVVRGEGEYPLYELLEFFIKGIGKIEDIAGVSYVDFSGKYVQIPQRPPIAQLDLLPVRKSGIDGTARKMAGNYSILTGRGCPFSCAFCYEGSVSRGVRLRGVENALSEIKQALEFNPNIKYIWFADDTFTLNPARMEAFSKGLTELRKKYDFVWFCECHPSTMIKWPETLPMMIDAGLVRMQIGMESGDPGIIKLYKKRASLDDIAAVVELAYKSGLPQLTGNMIIGGAAENKNTFKHTLAFAKKLIDIGPGMTDITSTFFIPLPKTAITESPSEFGIKILDPDSYTSIGDMAVIETKSLSRERIITMRREFTRQIILKMNYVYKKGRVPFQRIVNEFAINGNYCLESNWYKTVYSQDKFAGGYYKKMAAGVFFDKSRISDAELMNRCPAVSVRHLEMMTLDDGIPKIDGYVLSPLEYSLISKCSGNFSLSSIFEEIFVFFERNYRSRNEFYRTALKIVKNFEKKLWIGYLKNQPDCLNYCSEPVALELNLYGINNGELTPSDVTPDCGPKIIPAIQSIIKMNNYSEFDELRRTVEKKLKSGSKIVTGIISADCSKTSIDEIQKITEMAVSLVAKYPGIFEAFYDDKQFYGTAFEMTAKYESYAAAWQAAKSKVLAGMERAADNKKIDFKTILAHFELREFSGVSSVYYDKIFFARPLLYNYFTIMSRGAAIKTAFLNKDAGHTESSLRPQRTMAIWLAADFSGGYPVIGRDVLSPLEYELLLYCTGKLTLEKIYGIMNEKFSKFFDGFNELKQTINRVLLDFEEKYWIFYSRI
ncbi:MAG: radical SAM protein [Candidatus Wallbacteria bacterium]